MTETDWVDTDLQRRYEEQTRQLLALGGPDAALLADAMSRHGVATAGELSRVVRKDHPEFGELKAAVQRLLAVDRAQREETP